MHKTARPKSPSCTTFAALDPRVEQHHASSWPVAPTEFAGRLEPLGPFEPSPHLAVAVSGGPDSMALALLATTWVSERGGTVLALIVDHRIRPESTPEAATVAERLTARNIPSRILTLSGLTPGPALAQRARQARYHALATACREAGILHLLLGHHAADQAETLMIRVLAHSGPRGLAGMPALRAQPHFRLLRPLLGIDPARLRATLRKAGIPWVEDPSNTNPAALRPRLRLNTPNGRHPALARAAQAAAIARAAEEARLAEELASIASLHAEGYAIIRASRLSAAALVSVIRAVTGDWHPPPPEPLADLATLLRPATLAGARILPAGRLGPGFLLVREPRAMEPPISATEGAIWDNRFRLTAAGRRDCTIGPLAEATARLRHLSPLPAAILRTLPAIRDAETLVAVPHLGYPNQQVCAEWPILFSPSVPAAPAPFVPDPCPIL